MASLGALVNNKPIRASYFVWVNLWLPHSSDRSSWINILAWAFWLGAKNGRNRSTIGLFHTKPHFIFAWKHGQVHKTNSSAYFAHHLFLLNTKGIFGFLFCCSSAPEFKRARELGMTSSSLSSESLNERDASAPQFCSHGNEIQMKNDLKRTTREIHIPQVDTIYVSIP